VRCARDHRLCVDPTARETKAQQTRFSKTNDCVIALHHNQRSENGVRVGPIIPEGKDQFELKLGFPGGPL
jgi:hypothetical protein